MKNEIAIAYEGEQQLARAEELAKLLTLKIDNHAHQQLLVTADKLVLKMGNFSPLHADFTASTWQKRRDAGKQQGIVRACKPGPGISIIDTTAGWGRDAAVLASFGAQVIMLERQPILATLLADALMRRDEHSKRVLQLQLHAVDSFDYLQELTQETFPDVIYIDPMHPERQKAALVKKEMQVLQQLVNRDDKTDELIQLAKTKAKKRVVVKWPQRLPTLLKPDTSVDGKTVRFDIYLPSLQL
ncbi:class I SAM-dependent methyltransferase [Legionella jamestowniensis]|uniref:Ribosomal RNA small subunit methyltransferase J n=1 Tax=Legionella jamestowniensis TaxID=455 RepID=A0A0W0UM70_9GAMM|nr:class I SAM-dependent methyltransferase [Legionella jamestowniensis]KTD08633.1 SAM-dependent methyltransferase [Legionella jamestowniensis]OCH96920.1 SAM-dependent methyltransferase [Legionella jamestowniensis]SFL53879.1 16S rRNA (guanine1516-N2)-methyltransferase [Legionella jamestowniensis DSM 19215]